MTTNRINIVAASQGRPRVRQRADLRITVRFRYHCDLDLIRVLEEMPNKNAFIRMALRQAISPREEHRGR